MEEALDPYFPFEKALENWGRSFSKLGIEYKGATMTLDLLDRKGKYSNGFCHWPQPAWVKADGSFQVRKKPGFSMGFDGVSNHSQPTKTLVLFLPLHTRRSSPTKRRGMA